MAVERVKTGIPGLDDLVEGGIPKGSSVLVSGGAGAGKTIFSLQFLVQGLKSREKVLYVTVEQSPESIRTQARQFGWDLAKAEKDKQFKIQHYNLRQTNVIVVMKELRALLETFKPSRIVLDSISILGVYAEAVEKIDMQGMLGMQEDKNSISFSNDAVTRRTAMNIIKDINETGATALITSELPENSQYFSRDTVSEYVSDGVLVLSMTDIGGKKLRLVEVRKMRSTAMDPTPHLFAFDAKKGIVIKEAVGI